MSLENTPEPVSTQTDDGQAETDDLWGQASVASEEETDTETNLWGESTSTQSSTEADEGLSVEDLWGDAPEPSEDWKIDRSEERRVGREGRCRGARVRGKKKG